MNPWILLGCTIALEVGATSALKASAGFTRLPWALAAMAGYCLCFWLLSIVIKTIPMGVSYAIWSGVGMLAITAIDWLVFGQRLTPLQLACIGLILMGALGLQLITSRS